MPRFVRRSRTTSVRPAMSARAATGARITEPVLPPDGATIGPPSIDVIIPNWNGAETLPRALKAIENQTLRPRRVIVADACEDDTEPLKGTPSLVLTVGSQRTQSSPNG